MPAANRCITSSFSSDGIRPCRTSTRSPASGPAASCGATSSTATSGAPPCPRCPTRVLVEAVRGVVGAHVEDSSSPRPHVALVVAADPRADHVHLVPGRDLLAHPLPGPVQVARLLPGGDDVRRDRRPAGRQLGQRGHLEVAEHGHRDRARDRRGRHHQHVRRRDPPWPPAPRAARRRTGAARRRRPARGRRTGPAPRAARGCRRRCPPRRSRPAAAPGAWPRHPGEPVSSATRVPASAPPSIPRSASGPSRACIERWCCCASTSVGASSAACPPASTTAQHRPQRDHGLARADLALQQPVHRVARREVGGRAAPPTSRCPSVSVNGSRASNAAQQPVRGGHPRHRRQRRGRGAPPRQHDLQDERLVEPEPVDGAAPVRRRSPAGG